MTPITDGALFAALIAFVVIGISFVVDIERHIESQTIALQQIAASTSQIVRDHAAEQARLDKQDERIEEMLEHMAGVTNKKGKH